MVLSLKKFIVLLSFVSILTGFAEPKIELDQRVYKIYNLNKKVICKLTVEIKNTGTSDLKISRILLWSSEVKYEIKKTEIPPGHTEYLKLSIPKAVMDYGENGRCVIQSNAKNGIYHKFEILADGVNPIVIQPKPQVTKSVQMIESEWGQSFIIKTTKGELKLGIPTKTVNDFKFKIQKIEKGYSVNMKSVVNNGLSSYSLRIPVLFPKGEDSVQLGVTIRGIENPLSVALLKEEKNLRTLLPGSTVNDFMIHRIAHAGGAIDGITYTNSLEALNYSLQRGFQYFEIDFSFTQDDYLVCLHDWQGSFKRIFNFIPKTRMTLAQFNDLKKGKVNFSAMNLKDLANWMNGNSAYIITDVKGDNLKALKKIIKAIPTAKKRVIPQIYKPDNFQEVRAMGFEQIIWTLYRYPGQTEDVLRHLSNMSGAFAVTMSTDRFKSGLAKELYRLKIPVYVHNLNDLKEVERVMKSGATEIYTDYLFP